MADVAVTDPLPGLVRMTEEEARQYSQYEEGGKSPYDLYGALRIVIIISSLSFKSLQKLFLINFLISTFPSSFYLPLDRDTHHS